MPRFGRSFPFPLWLQRGVTVPGLTVSSTVTQTISSAYEFWVYTGTSNGTWTLPPVAGNSGVMIEIVNRSASNTLTVQRAGSDQIYYQQANLLSSMLLKPGGYVYLVCDGTYWLVLDSYVPQVVNDSSSISAVQSSLSSGSPFTWTHPGGSNLVLPYAIVLIDNTSTNQLSPLTGATGVVTYGGTTLSSLGAIGVNNSTTSYYLWAFGGVISNTLTGNQTVSATLTQSGKTFTGYGTAYLYQNVANVGSLVTNFGAVATASVSIPATSGLAWGAVEYSNQTINSFAFNIREQPTVYVGAGDEAWASGSSIPISANYTGGSPSWCAMGLSLT